MSVRVSCKNFISWSCIDFTMKVIKCNILAEIVLYINKQTLDFHKSTCSIDHSVNIEPE